MQTTFARMPGGQASSGAPVSVAAAAAQTTTGAEAQKSAVAAAQATTGAQAQKSAENMQTAFARMPQEIRKEKQHESFTRRARGNQAKTSGARVRLWTSANSFLTSTLS